MGNKRKPARIADNKTPTPTPPVDLPEVAKAEWKRITKTLNDKGILKPELFFSIRQYCTAYARLVKCELYFKTNSLIKYTHGGEHPDAHWKIEQSARKEVQTWLKSFGLTVESNNKLKSSEEVVELDDDLKELME